MECGELLQTSHAPKAKHRPLLSSEGLVGILHPVVQPTADLGFADGTELLRCGTVVCEGESQMAELLDHHFGMPCTCHSVNQQPRDG